MNDPRRTQQFGPPQPGSGSAWPQDYGNSPAIDYPAYADEMPYATYGGAGSGWSPGAPQPDPTQQLPPQYWQQGVPPQDEQPNEGSPRSPRWLWFLAGAAVLLVIGLVVALVIANGALKQQTAIEPLPPVPSTTLAPPTTRTTSPPSTTRRAPRTTTTAPPATTSPPGVPGTPGAMQTVVYSVSGEGRAISVMYMDAGDMIQTEFNVALPWTKQVSLSTSAVHPPSVTVVNIGHEITCSVTVAGVQVRQRTGQGLTFCDAPR
ncbi:MmpS family transport accessory protein [Mycobacterium sp. ML4]